MLRRKGFEASRDGAPSSDPTFRSGISDATTPCRRFHHVDQSVSKGEKKRLRGGIGMHESYGFHCKH